MAKPPRSYQLSSAIVASSVGLGVLCLATAGMGRTYALYARRPGPELNRLLSRADIGADLPSGAAHVIAPVKPSLVRVDISGPLEQRAGFHAPCEGWSDGHDAIADRMCEAFASGDVLLVIDSPGGAGAGLEQAIARVLEAKAHHGRRVTVWADEQIGSAAAWWALAVGDEVYLPPAGAIGSLGARAAHQSIAGALAKDGVEVSYFTWPDDGKIAFAPERPLSEAGKARGARDVARVGEAFCAAVCAGPVGKRHGLDRAAVVAMSADMLTGSAAVAAGLADGVASYGEVLTYALSLAEKGPVKASKDSSARVRARGETAMRIRSEEEKEARARAEDKDPPSSQPDGAPSSQPPGAPSSRRAEDEPGRDIPTKCGAAGCGVENDQDAKFCKGCGASMATGSTPPVDNADEPPPSSEPMRPGSARASTASFAEILGLPAGASLPAQKTRLLGWERVVSKASAITGQRDPDAMVGGLSAVAKDAGKAARYREERNELRSRADLAERMDLARRLVAAGEPRSRVFVDEVTADGKRAAVKLTPMYAEMRLGILRGEVEAREARAPKRNPFEPDRAAAQKAASDVRPDGVTREARIAAAEKNPSVIKLHQQALAAGNTGRTLAQVAAAWVDVEDAQNAAGGAQ